MDHAADVLKTRETLVQCTDNMKIVFAHSRIANDCAQDQCYDSVNEVLRAEQSQLESQNNKSGCASGQEGERTPQQWYFQKKENDGASHDDATVKRSKWSPQPRKRGNEKIQTD